MDEFDKNKSDKPTQANGSEADNVVDIAIARMKSGAVVKEERNQRFKFIFVAALCIAVLAAFSTLDFIYQTPDSETTADGQTTITLKQGQNGHFFAAGKINGEPVHFLVDTGASFVSIPMKVAKKIGLPLGASHRTITANGEGVAYETRMKSIELGDIKLTGVQASVTEGLKSEEILLGMSFLRKTKVVTDNGIMKITYYRI